MWSASFPRSISRVGGPSELVNVPARLVVKHPEALSFDEAASVWMQYVTAWGALVEQAKLGAGDTVIVTAASSSVGLAAFQVARMVGATVIATTRPAQSASVAMPFISGICNRDPENCF